MFQELFINLVLSLIMLGGAVIGQSRNDNNYCSQECEYYQARSTREYEACLLVQERRNIGECGLSIYFIVFMIGVGAVFLGIGIWLLWKCRNSVKKENGSVVQWLNS